MAFSHAFIRSSLRCTIRFAVGIMLNEGWQQIPRLSSSRRHFINNFKSVTGKVNIHLLCGIVLYMTDNLNVKPVFADNRLKKTLILLANKLVPQIMKQLGFEMK